MSSSTSLVDRSRVHAAATVAQAVLRRSPDLRPMQIATTHTHTAPPTIDNRMNTLNTNMKNAAASTSSSPSVAASVRFAHRSSLHSVLLSPSFSLADAQQRIASVLSIGHDTIVGVWDPKIQCMIPLSLVVRNPSAFNAVYCVVLEKAGVQQPFIDTHIRTSLPTTSASSSIVPRSAPSSSTAAQAALHKAQQLSRIAAESPVDSSVADDDVDVDDDDDDDGDDRLVHSSSSDDLSDDSAEEAARDARRDAEFEAAIDRALAASKGQQPVRAPTFASNGLIQTAHTHTRSNPTKKPDSYDSDGMNRFLDAEAALLKSEALKLEQQRETIAALRAEHARLQLQQQQTMARMRQHEQTQQQAMMALQNAETNATTVRNKINAATALKQSNSVNPQYRSFDQSDDDEDEDEEEDEEDEEDESEDDQDADTRLPDAYYPYDSSVQSSAATGALDPFQSRFVLSVKSVLN